MRTILFIILFSLIGCNRNYHITGSENLDVDSLGNCTSDSVGSQTITLGAGTSSDPYIICNIEQLQSMNNDLTAFYELGKNIDASVTAGPDWNLGSSGDGFIPIGGCGSNYANCSSGREFFGGSFDGAGFTIDSLFIDRVRGAVGLFGASSATAVITNVRLTNADISGSDDTGGIVARLYHELTNTYFSGSVSGGRETGGVAGFSSGDIQSASINAAVDCSNSRCGGAVGHMGGDATDVSISGSVTGTSNSVGGLAGEINSDVFFTNIRSSASVIGGPLQVGGLIGNTGYDLVTLQRSSASGDVTGFSAVGGLIGNSYDVNISDSFATGNIFGAGNSIGGVVGDASGNTSVSRSFATGNVSSPNSSSFVGAFAGNSNVSSSFEDCFATGLVTSSSSTDVGGFFGRKAPVGGVLTNISNIYPVPTSPSSREPSPPVSDFFDPMHPVYTAGSVWDFTSVWNSPANTALPSLQ